MLGPGCAEQGVLIPGRPLLPAAHFAVMVATFLGLGPALMFFIVRNTKQCWDFATSICIIHVVVSCLATLAFPVNWIWWVTLVPCGFLMSTGGELSCLYLRDMREIQLDKT